MWISWWKILQSLKVSRIVKSELRAKVTEPIKCNKKHTFCKIFTTDNMSKISYLLASYLPGLIRATLGASGPGSFGRNSMVLKNKTFKYLHLSARHFSRVSALLTVSIQCGNLSSY